MMAAVVVALGGEGGGVELHYKNDKGARTLKRLTMQFWYLLAGVLSFNRSTAGAFAIPLRVFN